MNIAIFEGPPSDKLKGWRHYQIRMSNGQVRTCICEPGRVNGMVRELRAKFFAAGTWEAEKGGESNQCFPMPRREILELLSSSGPLARPRGECDSDQLFCGSMRPNQMGCVV